MTSPTNFLDLEGKTILVAGIANRKSIAFHVARILMEQGAELVVSVRNKSRQEQVQKLIPQAMVLVCDLEKQVEIDELARQIRGANISLHGLLHSVAFADYESVVKPFHATSRDQFLRAVDVSCFSLLALCEALREQFDQDASVVATSISTTRMASENYGFMAPVKAALDSSLAFLAKSFSKFSRVRFNAIAPSLLKTSASAGIPGYVDSYLFAERVIPRKQALRTEEAANVAVFLLSPRSSGINAQSLVIDAGMSINYFDQDIVRGVVGDT